MKKELISMMLAAGAALGAWADTWTDPDTGYTWTYEVYGEEASIENGCSCVVDPVPSGAIVVPSTLGGCPVTSIGDYAFNCCSCLTDVTLPDNLTTIGWGAFERCDSLKRIEIPDGVTDIDGSAFWGCEGLTSVSLPESITNIGYHAFGSCTNLTSVVIPSKVETLWSTFEGCSNLKEVTLGASVSDFGYYWHSSAFSGCTSLTKIEIVPENQNFSFAGGLLLAHDGKEVVYVPEGRDYVFIPESVEKIPYYAFYSCPKLARATDKYGIESIDGWIVGCDDEKLPKQLVLNGYRGIAGDAFCECGELVSVVFGEGMTAIGNNSFSWCVNLNSISIPASMRKIDPEAFRCCVGLKSISVAKENHNYKFESNLLLSKDDSELIAVSRNATTAIIPEGVRYIPDGFFAGCLKLTSVAIPATVVDMCGGETLFYYSEDEDVDVHYWACPALKSITVAAGNPVFKSENGLLLWCDSEEEWGLVAVPQSLTKIAVPEGVSWIRDYAFDGCDKLSSIYFPSSFPSSEGIDFGDDFYRLPNLASISISEDNPWFSVANGLLLTKDGTRIRGVPRGVTKVALPASVADSGEGCFDDCNKLKSIAVEPGNKWFSSIGGMLVDSDGELVEVPRGLAGQTSIKIPAGVRRIGSDAFWEFEKLTSIDIPEGVEEIGNCAFYGCTSLSNVKLPSTLKVIGGYAFRGCPIKSILLPVGLEEIGRGAFDALAEFDTMTVPGLRLVDGWVFGLSETFEMDYADPEAYLNDALNSSRIKGIAGGAFDNCNGFLRKLKLPTCVKRISCWMFGNCGLPESIELPDGLTSIGKSAFVNCHLSSVAIPGSVKHIGTDAFGREEVLDKETIPGLALVDGWVIRSYGTNAIVGDDESFNGELTLSGEDGIRGIADKAFYATSWGCSVEYSGLSGVSNLVIGAGIVSIGEQAFAYNVDLTNVTIAASVEFVGKRAFNDCENLRAAYLPLSLYGKVPRDAFPAKTTISYCMDDGTVMPELAIEAEPEYVTDADGSLNLVLPVVSLATPAVTVSKLPSGLKFDPNTMTISGKLPKPGVYSVTVSATNATVKKPVTAEFEIVVPNLASEKLPGLEQDNDAYGVVMCGVALPMDLIDCTPEDGWTVKVAGLPAGLKFTAKDIVDSKTKKVTVPANTIYGVPTKAGTYTVTFTATKGKEKQVATITLNVEELPTWAQGTFTGYVAGDDGEYGSATMTVAANGKISGKIALDGTNWTFSAASFSRVEHVERVEGGVATNFVVEAVAKAGKVERKVALKVSGHAGRVTLPGGGFIETALPNAVARGTFGEGEVKMWRGMWKDKATAAAAKAAIEKFMGVYTVSVADGGDYGSGYLSLTVGKDGNVKATGKLADGTSVSATSPLMYDEDAGWLVMLYAAPSAYKGGAFAAAVGFDADGAAVAGRPPYRLTPVLFAPQWSSRNVQATGEYGDGFERDVDLAGAYYDKLDTLREYYESVRVGLDGAPELGFTFKGTYFNELGKKVTVNSASTASAVDTMWQDGLMAAVNEKGAIVVEKATKPVQDKETKEWLYYGANDGALTLSFTQATGIFKGSYTFWYDYESAYDDTTGKSTMAHTFKKVSFEGILVQGESPKMDGFYLWDATGAYEDAKTGKAKSYKYKQSFPVSLR